MTISHLARAVRRLPEMPQHVMKWRRHGRFNRAWLDAALAASVLLVMVLLFWFGYRATREWERSNRESMNRRGNEILVLLGTALERDMRGAFTRVLVPFNARILQQSSRYELADRFGGAFARFPYVESFFVWRRAGSPASTTYFFNRAEAPPPWDRASDDDDIYPVLIRDDPPAARAVIGEARLAAARGARFAAFDVSVEGVPYQAFVHLLYGGAGLDEVASIVGFTVNLRRVRETYFQDFIKHLQDLTGNSSLDIVISDERGRPVTRGGPGGGEPIGVKRFPLLFADPSLLAFLASDRKDVVWWDASVSVAPEASMLAAERATARTLTALVLAALVTVGGLAWTVRAARAAASLATAQSEFVSAMSHEMKTPLSLIGLASDTLANGRYISPAKVPEYGRLLSRETHHLRRLIDNVLCYARLHTSDGPPTFEPLDVSELVQDSVERFRPLLGDLDVDVQVQLPIDAVWIFGDRAMMHHALDNLIDNAAKHGGSGRRLTVRAGRDGERVQIDIADAGAGIPPDELNQVFDQFYRGRTTRARGSGLGLAIVRRIVTDHGGTVSIASELGVGTTITVGLPAWLPSSAAATASASTPAA